MIHKRGHSVLLGCCTRVGVGVAVEHVVPVIGGGPEIGGKSAVIVIPVAAIIGIAAGTRSGPVVIFHELRHSRGHAAHVGLVAAGAGTEVVVGCLLIPRGGEEGADGGDGLGLHRLVASTEIVPLFSNLRCRYRTVLYRRPDSAVIVAKPRTNVVWQSSAFAVVRIGIAEDRDDTVITRNQHEAWTINVVEDKEMLHTDALGQLLENRLGLIGEMQSPERLCEIFGFY